MKNAMMTAVFMKKMTQKNERGDVPGWVMITVMTAGLVAILTTVAGPQLRNMLVQALTAVGG